ncbi:MAG: nucleoside-diphosphate kinase [Candidatus Paceibacterota bacterium]
MREKCLVLIKPDGISRGLLPLILDNIRQSGLVILEQKFLTATEDQCKKHHNIKTRNYGATEEQIVDYLARSYIKNENICAMILKGENAVERALEVKMKIRETYCTDDKEKCKREGRALHNIMHSSESVEDTEKEIDVWLK